LWLDGGVAENCVRNSVVSEVLDIYTGILLINRHHPGQSYGPHICIHCPRRLLMRQEYMADELLVRVKNLLKWYQSSDIKL